MAKKAAAGGSASSARSEVLGDGDLAGRWIGGVPAAVGLRGFDGGHSGLPHAAGLDERRGLLGVDERPLAAGRARGEALERVVLVVAGDLAVDPAEAQGDVERLRVGDRFDGRGLLGELQPYPAGVVVGLEPALPGRLVGGLEDGQAILAGLAHGGRVNGPRWPGGHAPSAARRAQGAARLVAHAIHALGATRAGEGDAGAVAQVDRARQRCGRPRPGTGPLLYSAAAHG